MLQLLWLWIVNGRSDIEKKRRTDAANKRHTDTKLKINTKYIHTHTWHPSKIALGIRCLGSWMMNAFQQKKKERKRFSHHFNGWHFSIDVTQRMLPNWLCLCAHFIWTDISSVLQSGFMKMNYERNEEKCRYENERHRKKTKQKCTHSLNKYDHWNEHKTWNIPTNDNRTNAQNHKNSFGLIELRTSRIMIYIWCQFEIETISLQSTWH